MAIPLVSVLLLTHNGADTLPGVLAAIKAQDVPFPYELVAVDSGSRDGTTDLLRAQVDTLIDIREADFNHGTTRNLGIEACRAPFVVLLVQDAEPESPAWLSRLVAPLLRPARRHPSLPSVRVEDCATDPVAGQPHPRHPSAAAALGTPPDGRQPPASRYVEHDRFAGTYARQVARPGASGVTRAYLARYAAAGTEPRVQSLANLQAFDSLSPAERLAACTFDNVCSCISRAVWQAHPFRATPVAEDVEWAKDVMLAGYQLAYVAEALVVHSHNRAAGYELRRTYLVHQRLRRLFGLATVPSRLHLARSIAVSAATHARWTLSAPIGGLSKIGQLPRALALAVALPLGQYLGARSADAGRELLRARGV
jgi:rhamnosyltransferase